MIETNEISIIIGCRGVVIIDSAGGGGIGVVAVVVGGIFEFDFWLEKGIIVVGGGGGGAALSGLGLVKNFGHD